MNDSYKTYEQFTGKISPFLLFEMEYHSLSYIVENHKNDRFYPETNPASQVASIGLLSYFEAFCKHQFAAIVNLFPQLINDFAAKRGEPVIEFSTIISFEGEFEKNIGFVLAENYDFGTAKSINGLFRDLLFITPFSKEEKEQFESIVHKRNLLVHHAGYYTLQHFKKNARSKELKEIVFKEAVKIDTEEYETISTFLFEMAMKITKVSVKALRLHPIYELLTPDDDKINAVTEMLAAVYDTLEEAIDPSTMNN